MNTRTRSFLTRVAFSVAVMGAASYASAVTIDVDLSGTFAADNDVFTVEFELDSDRLVSFFTSSWLAPDSGLGFDTAFFLWDDSGNWLGFPSGYADDVGLGGSAESNSVAYNYGENDAYLNAFLGAGAYTLTLVQTGNVPVGFAGPASLVDGFIQDSEPNYTRDVYGWGANPFFNGAAGNDPRTGNWELHLVGISDYSIPNTNPVPEPASLTLLAMGVGCCALRYRRRGQQGN